MGIWNPAWAGRRSAPAIWAGPLLVIGGIVMATTAWTTASSFGREQAMSSLPAVGENARRVIDPDAGLPPSMLTTSSAMAKLSLSEVGLLNGDRSVAGLPPLIESPALDRIAEERAVQMASTGGSHYLPGHSTPAAAELLQAEAIPYLWRGENIAWESGMAVDQQATFFNAWWMDSPEHQANILGAHFARVGIGAVDSGGWVYIAEEFTD